MEVAEGIAGRTARLQPGTRLGTKAELQEEWGVSAATLNEALRLLQARGSIRLRSGPSGGVFVAAPDPLVRIGQALVSANSHPTAIVDAVALRDALDPITVLEAARYRTDEDVRALRVQLGRLHQALSDDTAFVLEIWELHRMIVRLGRNEMLREISLGLLEIIATETHHVVVDSKPLAQREARLQVHEKLVDAIESGDPQQCAAVSEAHRLEGHGLGVSPSSR